MADNDNPMPGVPLKLEDDAKIHAVFQLLMKALTFHFPEDDRDKLAVVAMMAGAAGLVATRGDEDKAVIWIRERFAAMAGDLVPAVRADMEAEAAKKLQKAQRRNRFIPHREDN